jgi:hypothetical protein
MNVALELDISPYSPYIERSPLTVLHHPGHKAWLALSLKLQGNVDHLENTLSRVSTSFGVSLDKKSTDMAWTNVVTFSRLPGLKRLASVVHASKVP